MNSLPSYYISLRKDQYCCSSHARTKYKNIYQTIQSKILILIAILNESVTKVTKRDEITMGITKCTHILHVMQLKATDRKKINERYEQYDFLSVNNS